MFHQFVEYGPRYRTIYHVGLEESITVSRHRYSEGSINISSHIGGGMLHIYPDDQFEYMQTAVDIYTKVPYTRGMLKTYISSQTSSQTCDLDVYERHRCIDDIIINDTSSSHVLGSTGRLQFRIKYWSLKRSSLYASHPFVVPYSLGLVQQFHTNSKNLLICDIQEFHATYTKLDSHRISSFSKINYGVHELLQSLYESDITNMGEFSYARFSNKIGEKIIDTTIQDFVHIFTKRFGNISAYKIMLTGSLLRYPLLSEKYIHMLSKQTGSFVGIYIGDSISFGLREWSTDELYIKHHIYRFSQNQKSLSSFSTPTI